MTLICWYPLDDFVICTFFFFPPNMKWENVSVSLMNMIMGSYSSVRLGRSLRSVLRFRNIEGRLYHFGKSYFRNLTLHLASLHWKNHDLVRLCVVLSTLSSIVFPVTFIFTDIISYDQIDCSNDQSLDGFLDSDFIIVNRKNSRMTFSRPEVANESWWTNFHEMLHLSTKRLRSISWWEDALWKTFGATI